MLELMRLNVRLISTVPFSRKGSWITLNGTTGEVILGKVDLIDPELTGNFGTLMEWADEFRALGIRTNADTPNDARVAREFGAEGIGLCRTKHMFFEGDRIKAVRQMILSKDQEGREKALALLLPYQKDDFIGIFKEMKEVTSNNSLTGSATA